MAFKDLTPAGTEGASAPAASVDDEIAKLKAQLEAAQKKAEAAAAAPAPEPELTPEPEPVTAEPATEEETAPPRAVAAVGNLGQAFGLSVPKGGERAVMDAWTAGRSGGGALFPVVQQSAGNSPSAGGIAPAAFVKDEIGNRLPQGKKPFNAVFIAYRTEVVAWPVGFGDKSGGGENNDKAKPAYGCAIPSTNAKDSELAREACEAYQYTKTGDKGKFDYKESGAGHPRPSCSLLLYSPDIDGLFELRTASHLDSLKRTVNELGKYVDPQSGALGQFPVSIKTAHEAKTVNGNDIRLHWFNVSQVLNEETKFLWNQFQEWFEKSKDDAAIVNAVRDWIEGRDRPITEKIRTSLQAAANLGS